MRRNLTGRNHQLRFSVGLVLPRPYRSQGIHAPGRIAHKMGRGQRTKTSAWISGTAASPSFGRAPGVRMPERTQEGRGRCIREWPPRLLRLLRRHQRRRFSLRCGSRSLRRSGSRLFRRFHRPPDHEHHVKPKRQGDREARQQEKQSIDRRGQPARSHQRSQNYGTTE